MKGCEERGQVQGSRGQLGVGLGGDAQAQVSKAAGPVVRLWAQNGGWNKQGDRLAHVFGKRLAPDADRLSSSPPA